MKWSIRRRLLTWLVSGVFLSGIIATLLVYIQARDEVAEVYDKELKEIALTLRNQEDLSVTQSAFQNADEDEDGIVVSAWDRGGRPVFGLARGRTVPSTGRQGYATVIWEDQPWRVYVATGSGGTVEVAQPISARARVAMGIVTRILLPTIPVAVALIVLMWLSVNRGLKPLADVAGVLAARTGATLDSVVINNAAREVIPFISALNDLLDRLRREVTKQKHFVSDAAHELRTPLAALQLQLELIEAADSIAERNAALAQLRRGIERLTHLTQQLLMMARLDPEDAERTTQVLDLSEIAVGVMGALWPLAKAKNIDLGSVEHGRMLVQGDPERLRVLLTNIVDNAIKYTPSGGKVDINLRQCGRRVELEVIDTGCGVPAEERDRVFDRFYRGIGQSTDGSGLGLAIVKRIAERCGATITLESGSNGHGLRFCVFFETASVR